MMAVMAGLTVRAGSGAHRGAALAAGLRQAPARSPFRRVARQAGTVLTGAARRAAVTAVLLVAGCASIEPPSITLSDLRMEKSSLFEQRFVTTLRVQNPNTVDLDVEGVTFDLVVNDQPFAKGVGQGNVVVPAYGSGLIEAEAITTLMGFVRQLGGFTNPDGPKLSYRVAGKLKLRNRALAVPFEMRGDDLLRLRRPAGPE